MGSAALAELQWRGGATEVRIREGTGVGQERWIRQGGGTESWRMQRFAYVQQVIERSSRQRGEGL